MGKLLGVVILTFFLAGCTNTQPASTLTQLQFQVAQLEKKLDDRDQEIADLKYQMDELNTRISKPDQTSGTSFKETLSPAAADSSDAASVKKEGIIRVEASIEDVQSALKKAGCYDGEIDGKIGNKTKAAIEQFQKDRGLKIDGVVGEKTWKELKTYLNTPAVENVSIEPEGSS